MATVFQTTGNGYREWNVYFETSCNVVEDVIVTNLNAPYAARLSGAKLDVLDLNGDIVASRTLTGDAGAQTYVFNERPIGSSVRISKTVAGGANLHAREVEVYGFATAQTQISGYDSYSTGGCAGRNELGQTTGGALQACADACNADLTCVSFEYAKTGTSCQRSTSCDHVSTTVNNLEDPMNFYLKLPAGRSPSTAPSLSPSAEPSSQPSISLQPSVAPSRLPSTQPSAVPTVSLAPSAAPSVSFQPSSSPTALDSDKDGVPDSIDEVRRSVCLSFCLCRPSSIVYQYFSTSECLFFRQCRYQGGHVDAWGCPIDTDDDGIADCISDLHYTLSGCDFDPQSNTFNSTCCNIEWDRCFSDTPPGANSTSTLRAYVQNSTYENSLGQTIEPGCTSDEDEDGVVDGIDQCINTTTVEKELAAKADGKMTLYTTGPNAGCAILNSSVWDSIFLDVVTNSSNILADPGLEAVFAVDSTMVSAQSSRIGAGFGAASIARFSVLDPSCTRKYDDVTQTGDELFTITMYLNDLSQSSFTGQIPESTVPLSAYIDFNPTLITQSPLWELEYPFSIGTVACCIRLELLSKDGGEILIAIFSSRLIC